MLNKMPALFKKCIFYIPLCRRTEITSITLYTLVEPLQILIYVATPISPRFINMKRYMKSAYRSWYYYLVQIYF